MWSYKKKTHKKIEAYRKSVYKEPTVERCLLILDLKSFRSWVKGKHSIVKKNLGGRLGELYLIKMVVLDMLDSQMWQKKLIWKLFTS